MSDDVAAAFEYLAEWAEGSSRLYERLCRIVATDPELLDLAAAVPEDRATANVFLAAIHYRLLGGPAHRLGEYYPTVVEESRPPDDALGEHLRDFCRREADHLRPLLETRRTQTNEVGRSAALAPGIAHVASRVDGPLALVELGPSAGLNLYLDRYEIDYGGAVLGPEDPGFRVESELRGDGQPPLAADLPPIHSRIGIDRNPLDVTDPNDCDWLRALVWPDQDQRHRQLGAALETARQDPPEIVEGDILEDLPAVLNSIPQDVTVCLFDTLVLYQVSEEVRERVTATIERYATERPLHWLAGEDELRDREGIRLEWTRGVDGEARTDRLAGFEQHGRWVEWYGTDG